MSHVTSVFDYNHWVERFQALKKDLMPIELQGLAMAFVCLIQESLVKSQWLKFLQEEYQHTVEEENYPSFVQMTEELLEFCIANFKTDFNLQLCLPSDETPLPVRVKALSDWCHGFIYGLAVKTDPAYMKAKEMQDILRDLCEITKVTLETCDEEEEKAYTELVEYVRLIPFVISEVVKSLQHSTPTIH
ncbi:MAG TPA: UPF0149 family protein [Gammaproteobacteria bacterium]|nr:UPF0149 family protein [Gammaproteobacteria bacterium]